MADHRASANRLRAATDSGKTRDKIPLLDPAAAPLGTDDEAAGTPASRHDIPFRAQAVRGPVHGFSEPNPHLHDVEKEMGFGKRRWLFIVAGILIFSGIIASSILTYLK